MFAALVGRAQYRQRAESRDLGVIREGAVHIGHGALVPIVPFLFLALAVEDLDGGEPHPLSLGGGHGLTVIGRSGQPAERFERLISELLIPERVVPGHRLAPVRHGEVGIGILGLSEG